MTPARPCHTFAAGNHTLYERLSVFGGTTRRARARHLAIAHRTGISRTLAAVLVAGLLAPLVVFVSGAGTQEAAAVTYDAASIPLKFQQSSRVAVVGTGTAAGDIQKYVGAATIAGVKIDAVVKTVALQSVTFSKFDEGSALTAPPPGSTLIVDDVFTPNLDGLATAGNESMVTFQFDFYETGTYTGVGTGVPLTLTDVTVNSYDIDGNGSAGVYQFTDFRGFQSYTTYTSGTKGVNISNQGNGNIRLIARETANVNATSGSYSFARVKVNYDRVNKITARVGEIGGGLAYFALDFSAGGIWTTDGTNVVTPVTQPNPFNTAPVTQDVSTFYAAQSTGYVFTSSDFPYSDIDDNAFAALTIVSLPAAGQGILEYRTADGWLPVTAGQVFSTDDIEVGVLRLTPTASGGTFTFQVQDGQLLSNIGTLTYTAPANSQSISFPAPGAHSPSTSFPAGATASSGLTTTLTSKTPGVCTVSGQTVTALALPSGVTSATCVIVATQPGDPTYGRAEPVTQQFAVSSLPSQTITFPAPADRPFTSASIASGATTSAPGHTPSLTSLTPEACTISGLAIVPVAPGYCSVRATSPGDAGYSAAAPVTVGFTIAKAVQAITFAQPSTVTLDSATRTVAATTDASGLTPALTSDTPAVCTLSGATVTYVATGTCTLTATQSGNTTYAAAAPVSRSFAIIDITTTALDGGQVGTAHSQTLTVAGTGGTWATSTTLPAGVTLDPATGAFGGTPTATFSAPVTITYTQNGATDTVTLNYEVVAAAAPAPQTITFAQPGSYPLADGSTTVAPTSDAVGLTPTLASSTPAVCTVSGFTVSFATTGLCTVTASEPGDATRAAAADVTRSFAVFEVGTAALPQGSAGSAYSQPLTVTGSAGTGVWSTTVALPTGLTLDAATGILSGTPTVGFDQHVPFTYTENGGAETVTLHLVVVVPPAPQVISFVNPGTRALNAGSITVSPTSDSGLTPALVSSAQTVCTASGFTITFVASGLCTVTASQGGDASHSAAADVARTFRVIEISTASVPSGREGDGYSQGLATAGTAGGGAWSAANLPAGLVLDPATGVISGTPTAAGAYSLTVDYTEGGATATRSLVVVVVPPTVAAPAAGSAAGTPSTPAVPRGNASPAAPAATATPTAKPSARPTAAPAAATTAKVTAKDTIDLGGSAAQAAGKATVASLTSQQRDQAVRTRTALQAEHLAGFGKNSKGQVEVIGAKTLATLVVAADASIDTTAVAETIRDATGDQVGDFARLTAVSPTTRPATVPTVRVPLDDMSYFRLSRLGEATPLSSIDTSASQGWMHFSVDITGYKPGTTAYLAMTSSPVVFASKVVGNDGTAHLEGDMALDVLPVGVHRLRVVGDRAIGPVTSDANGEILLTAAQLAEIAMFDQGTDAAVIVSGESATGGEHIAVRIVPLDQQVPWWLVWMLAGLALVLVASRLAGVAERTAGRWIKRVALVLGALVPIAVGLILDEPILSIVAAAVALVGLVLTRAVPVARKSYEEESYDYAPRFDTGSAWQN